MKIKTNELVGTALDLAVAKCKYPKLIWGSSIGIHHASHQIVIPHLPEPKCYWSPSTDWAQGGPIIERKGISIDPYYEDSKQIPNAWSAYSGWDNVELEALYVQAGPTPLIAAMRCYVASKLGDEVEIPDELCQPSL